MDEDKPKPPQERPLRPELHFGHTDEPIPEGVEPPPPGVKTAAIVRWALVVLMAALALLALLSYYR